MASVASVASVAGVVGLVSALAAACGGSTTESLGTSRDGGGSTKDGGKGASHDAPRVDSYVALGDGGCVANPTFGGACTPGASTACNPGDRCCVGYEWECGSKGWEQQQLGCYDRSCVESPDASAETDAPRVDASNACGCKASEICVVTVSCGGPCLMPNDAGMCPNGQVGPPGGGCCNDCSTQMGCKPRPAACDSDLSCTCATSVCTDGCFCQSAMATTVNCACDFP